MSARRVAAGRWLRRLLTPAFVALALWLVMRQLRAVDTDAVGRALADIRPEALLLALLLTAFSYLLYGAYELIARSYVKHRLPKRRVAAIALVSYAFNLNLSAWIGGIGFRFRLYRRSGLHAGMIGRILGLSLATNWLGYLVLAGSVFSLGLLPLPADWRIGPLALRIIGGTLLLLAIAYLLLAARARRRSYTVRGHEFQLPPLRMALVQFAASCLNWLTIAAVLYVLLRQAVPYPVVLSVLLVAAIAGVVAHIPAGLGVIEGVFLAFLGPRLGEDVLLAGLLCYRAVYYLVPLVAAVLVYFALEAHSRRQPAGATAAPLSARR